MSSPVHKLFSPIQVGNTKLKHRVVLAPLTRFRATRSSHVPVVPLVKEYYSQRGSVAGTLLITEATFIAPEAGGYRYAPGIYSKEQIEAWKEVSRFRLSQGISNSFPIPYADNSRSSREGIIYLPSTVGSRPSRQPGYPS